MKNLIKNEIKQSYNVKLYIDECKNKSSFCTSCINTIITITGDVIITFNNEKLCFVYVCVCLLERVA